MTEPVTLERLKAAKYRWLGHINMGGNGHLMAWACDDFPRLAISKLSKRGVATRTITVDGHEVADFEEAARRLSGPPIEPPAIVDKVPRQLGLAL